MVDKTKSKKLKNIFLTLNNKHNLQNVWLITQFKQIKITKETEYKN